MTETFNFGTPADLDQADGVQIHMLGVDWFSVEDGESDGIEWYRPTNVPTNTLTACMWNLDTEELLASKVFTAPTAGLTTILFDAAVPVAADQHYVSAVLTNRYAFTASGGGWPFSTTNLRAQAGVNSRIALNTGGALTFPENIHGSAVNFHVSPRFDLGAAVVNLVPAVASLAAQTLNPVPGVVIIDLAPANVALAAQALSPVPGLVTVTLTPATVTLTAQVLGIGERPGTLVAGGTSSTLVASGTSSNLTASGLP